MRMPVPIMAALLALAACGASPESLPTATATPNVLLPAVAGRPAAGYFELRISGDRGALVSLTSPQAGRIEMHETRMDGNMSSMRPLPRVPVRDGEILRFAPGARHLMLFDLDPAVRAGGQMILTLNFERGAPRPLGFAVLGAGGHAGH